MTSRSEEVIRCAVCGKEALRKHTLVRPDADGVPGNVCRACVGR